MRFFVPRRLVELVYLGGHADRDEAAARYRHQADFAFLAVNLGYSRAEYEALTPCELMFIMKAYENRVVGDSSMEAAAVSNAVGNCFRKKGKKARRLWRTRPKAGDMEKRAADEKAAREILAHEGNDWVKRVYAANGRPLRKRGGRNVKA